MTGADVLAPVLWAGSIDDHPVNYVAGAGSQHGMPLLLP